MRIRSVGILLSVVGSILAYSFFAISLGESSAHYPAFVWGRLFTTSIDLTAIGLALLFPGGRRFRMLGLLRDERNWNIPWRQGIALIALAGTTLCARVGFDLLWYACHA